MTEMWERRSNTQTRNSTSVGSIAPVLPCTAGEADVAYGTKTGNNVGTDRARGSDRQLVNLLVTERALDKHVAIGLARVWDEQKYRTLGHARGVDYVQERLGMKPGKARWLVKVGRAITEYAELNQALTTGRLSASQVVELAPALNACSKAERAAWVEQAASLTVRALRALIRGESNDATTNPGDAGETIDGRPDSDSDIDPGVWFSLKSPARVGELWPLATNLARKVSGQHLPHYCCAELIAAEYLSFATDAPLEGAGDHKCGRSGDLVPSAAQTPAGSNTSKSSGAPPPGKPSPDGTSPGGTSPGGTSPDGTSPGDPSPAGTSPGGTSPSGESQEAGLRATLHGSANSPAQPAKKLPHEPWPTTCR